MPRSELSPEVRRSVATRYLLQAFGEKTSIPWEVGAELLGVGVFKSTELPSPLDTQLLKAIADIDASIAPPLVMRLEPDGAGAQIPLVELSECLSARTMAVATAVSPLISRAVSRYAAPRGARDLLPEYEAAVASQDLARVMPAAAGVADLLATDWSWQVALLSESVREGFDDFALRQVERLLRTDFAEPEMLNYLQGQFSETLQVLEPTSSPAELSLEEARERILSLGPRVAHLPWRAGVGFSDVLARVRPAESVHELWTQIRGWLDEKHPSCWFHVWLTAMSCPGAVPSNDWAMVWERVALLAAQSLRSSDGSDDGRQLVDFYESLLKFYFYRIETGLPNARSDFVFWSASKLASDVVAAVGAPADARISSAFSQTSEDAKNVWQVASPNTAANELRSAFLDYRAYWPVAIQASIQEWAASPVAIEIPDAVQAILTEMVRTASVRLCASTNATLGQMSSLVLPAASIVNAKWQEVLHPSHDVSAWIGGYTDVKTRFEPATVMERFRAPMSYDGIDGIVTILRWTSLVRSGEIPLDRAVDILCGDAWLATVEPTMKPDELEHVVQAVLSAPWTGRASLRVELAHWAARLCIANLHDDARRELYCAATVFLSLKGATSSALVRLRREDQDNLLANELHNVSDMLTEMLEASPAWVRGRVGAVLAVIDA